MLTPALFADFQNADALGRVRLNLGRLGVRLVDGLRITLHDEDLEADGEVVFSADEKIWVAKIDWNALRNISRPA